MNLIYPVLYAETHYTFPGLFSLLKRRQPEILADAPFRVEPSSPIPLLCLIKDAHRYPITLERVSVSVRAPSGSIQRIDFPLHVSISEPFWHRVLPVEAFEPGRTLLDVRFYATRKGKRWTVRNDNYRTVSHDPLLVEVAPEPLPRAADWYYGEPHAHTQYTNDQVEFGAPIAATVELARAMGLSWFAATDHSYDLDDCSDNFLRNDPDHPLWRALKRDIERAHQEHPDFVALIGEEVSCGNAAGQNVHLLAYGLSDLIVGKGDSAERWFRTRPDRSVSDVLEEVRRQGGVAYAAHPLEPTPFFQRKLVRRGNWHWEDLLQDGLSGLQFWNGKQDRGLVRGKQAWIALLLEGKRVFALGGDDAHGNFNRFRQIGVPFVTMRESNQQRFGAVRTALYLPDGLSKPGMLEALRTGRSVITDGPFVAFHLESEAGERVCIGGTISGGKLWLEVEAE
ncbi:MAG: CehA/McbA family metallohydrolase, partial [Candidatus Latescibacteria bacterium]|nr:CehA/McbA family metallohydrolase [Candidatus Latescibacterota bacterium]